MADYSIRGGSAGARMAAWVGTYGTSAFGPGIGTAAEGWTDNAVRFWKENM